MAQYKCFECEKSISSKVLEKRFGMVLSDTGVPLHEPIVRFFTPEAKERIIVSSITKEAK